AMCADRMLKVYHARIVRLAQYRDRAGEGRDYLLIEQNAHGDPVPQTVAGAIHVWTGFRHEASTTSMFFGSPTSSALRQVAELENVIAAAEAVAAEEMDRGRRISPAAGEPWGA
ncbi:hypothetical protein MKK82_15385, partial [Methylobacterium sp. E-046]|nr:hypothetical protein [Methylobacterium sp. E-046]